MSGRRGRTWNHRLTREGSGEEAVYGIREVHYRADGSIEGWTLDPVAAVGESVEEVVSTLQRMLAAAQEAPVVDLVVEEKKLGGEGG